MNMLFSSLFVYFAPLLKFPLTFYNNVMPMLPDQTGFYKSASNDRPSSSSPKPTPHTLELIFLLILAPSHNKKYTYIYHHMLPGLSRLDNHKMQYLLYDQKRIKHSKRTFNRGMSQRFHHISMSYNFDEMAQCSNAEFPLYYIGRNVCSSLPQNPYRSFWQHPGYLAMSL